MLAGLNQALAIAALVLGLGIIALIVRRHRRRRARR
jgi:hypothetical protein